MSTKFHKLDGFIIAPTNSINITHICKINMDTDLRLAFTSAVRQSLANAPENINPREYLSMARDNVCNNCLYAIREIMNSENKI